MTKIIHRMKKVSLFLTLIFTLASCKGNGMTKDSNPDKPAPKPQPDANNILIESVTLDNKKCNEGSTVLVEKKDVTLKIIFKEKYEKLKVIVNEKEATMSEKEATCQIRDLTKMDTEIKILAKAKNKDDRSYSFKARLMEEVEIGELKFIGENLNPAGQTMFDKKVIAYSSDPTKPPLLSDIKADGSTKIGSTKSFELEVWVMFKDADAKEKILKIENKTNNKTSTTTVIQNKSLQTKIPLKNGENQLVITYSEKDKKPISYSVRVDYEEPEYNPIDQIIINGKYYSNKETLDKLIAGSEIMNIEGASKLPIKISMKDVWYKDEGWSLKVNGEELPKDKFNEIGSGSYIRHEIETSVNLNANAENLVKITFENPNRENYSKEYKINIKHKLLHKLRDLIFIEEKISNYISGYKFSSFKKDESNPNQFNLQVQLKASDWASKALFLLDIESENVTPKYAILKEKKDPETIQSSDWKDTEKKTIKYKQYSNYNEKEGFVATSKIEYGKSYLYVLLEGNGAKMFYMAEIMRTKESVDNKDEDSTYGSVFLNADDEGNILANRHPFSTKIIAKIRPKNPRAKVKILEPEEKELDLNVDGTYFEYILPLNGKITTLKYKIISEDGLNESSVKQSNFTRDPAIKSVKFAYEEKAYSKKANLKDEEYYIPISKTDVKENKLYLHLEVFKGLNVTSNNLPETKEKEEYDSSVYTYTLDVSSILNGSMQDYEGNVKFNGKSTGVKVKIHLFKGSEDIKEIKIAFLSASEFPNNEYEFTKLMDVNGENVHVLLYKTDNETKENTKQKVVILHDTEERELEISEDSYNKALKFTLKDLKLPKNVDATLIIKYYKNKDDASATPKEYKLKIYNRKA